MTTQKRAEGEISSLASVARSKRGFDVSSATSMGCVSVPFPVAVFFFHLTFKAVKGKLNTQLYQANNN
jgi:hypothetical protein